MYNTYKSAVKWPLDDQKRRRLGALDLIQNHRLTPFRPFLRSPIHHRRPFLMYISACLCSSSRGGGGGTSRVLAPPFPTFHVSNSPTAATFAAQFLSSVNEPCPCVQTPPYLPHVITPSISSIYRGILSASTQGSESDSMSTLELVTRVRVEPGGGSGHPPRVPLPPPLMCHPHCLSGVHGKAPLMHPSLTRRLRGTQIPP